MDVVPAATTEHEPLIFLDIDGVICCNNFSRLEEDKLAQLEKDIAGSLLRATADSGASSPKTGGGGQASLA